MGRVDDNQNLDLLRHANAHLGQFFLRFSGAPVLGTQEEVEALLQVEQVLHSIAVLLDGRLQKTEDHNVRQEVTRYRENLLRLQSTLGDMRESAAGCRDHLQSRLKHLHAAQAWCAASRAAG